MAALLPVGEYFEFKSEDIGNFVPENTPRDGKYWYLASTDYNIPDDVKLETDDLPMSAKQEIITADRLSPFSIKWMSDKMGNNAKPLCWRKMYE